MPELIKIVKVIICVVWSCSFIYAQDSESGSVYSTPILSNPALSGSEASGKLRLLYRDYYPSQNLKLHTIYCSFDTYSEQLHGGFGFYMIENMMGDILNDFRAGATYSYHLRASRNLYINAGFMASIIHRGINAGNLVLPDQIDPVLGSVLPTADIISSSTRTVFDAGVGFLASYLNYNAGFSVNHLSNPDLTAEGSGTYRLPRRFTFHGSANFSKAGSELQICPLFILNKQANFAGAGIGGSLGYNVVSINILPYADFKDGLSYFQSGISLETGRFMIGYNYCFNLNGKAALMPFTLSNQLIISLSLKNVEKRDMNKAIIYPKM